MLDMLHKDILPAVSCYTKDLVRMAMDKKAVGIEPGAEVELAKRLSGYSNAMYAASVKLSAALEAAEAIECPKAQAEAFYATVLPAMAEMREAADAAEALTGGKYLPYPTYGELLYGVNE